MDSELKGTTKIKSPLIFREIREIYGVFYQLFSLPGRSPGRAIVLPQASASALALAKC